MRRRDVRGRAPGQVRHGGQGRMVDDDAARHADRLDGGAVAGVLDQDVSGAERTQELAQGVGGAGGQQDLVRGDGQAAGAGEPLRQGLAQLGQTARVGIAAGWPGHGDLPPRAAPAREVPRVDPGRARVQVGVLRLPGGRPVSAGLRRKGLPGGDEGAGTAPGRDPGLGQKLVVRLLDHGAGHPEVGCQGAAGGQAVAGAEGSVGDQRADRGRELGGEGFGAGAVEPDGEHGLAFGVGGSGAVRCQRPAEAVVPG